MKKFLTALATAGLLVGVFGTAAPRHAAATTPAIYVAKSGSLSLAGNGNCKSPNYTSIQTAIDNADDNTTIIICPGVWRLTNSLDTDETTGLVLQGISPSKTIIDGTDANSTGEALINTYGYSTTGNYQALTLRFLTVQNARNWGYGAVRAGDFTCDHVTFKNNSADDWMGPGLGGAVSAFGDATFNACTFIGNQGEHFGGAAYIDGSLTDHGSVYRLNAAGAGGALYINDMDNVGASISGSTFVQNRAIENFVAIRARDTSSWGSESGDGGEGDGGAVLFSSEGDLVISASIFTKNYADDDGGAVDLGDDGDEGYLCDAWGDDWCEGGGNVTITSSKFTSNEANATVSSDSDGGAVANENGLVTAFGSLFQANQAGEFGGAIYGTYYVEISGNRFIGNHAYGNFWGAPMGCEYTMTFGGAGGASFAEIDYFGDPDANQFRGNRDADGADTYAYGLYLPPC